MFAHAEEANVALWQRFCLFVTSLDKISTSATIVFPAIQVCILLSERASTDDLGLGSHIGALAAGQ